MRKKQDNSKEYIISFRVDEKERQALQAESKQVGGSISLLLRKSLAPLLRGEGSKMSS